MGILDLNTSNQHCTLQAHLITYGRAATPEITQYIALEIESMWNEPAGVVRIDGADYTLRFQITSELRAEISELEVLQNTDPRNNYFRIEDFVSCNISFVDGIGSNTGVFKLENLYRGSTTAAHEFGHTIGLVHPDDLDIRGQGVPGIMYPRGTLVDARYQYDFTAAAGMKGGTLHPQFRKVRQLDVDDLRIHRLDFKNNMAIIGEFTNVFHWEGE